MANRAAPAVGPTRRNRRSARRPGRIECGCAADFQATLGDRVPATGREERIAQARCRRGESQATIEEALALSELNTSEVEQEDDLYLCVLARYVAALGGHLEVLAVFPEETIAVRREPDHHSKPEPARSSTAGRLGAGLASRSALHAARALVRPGAPSGSDP